MRRIYRHQRALPLHCLYLVTSTILILGIQSPLPAHTSVVDTIRIAWGNLFKSQPPPPKRGVGRGDFCLIAPSSNQTISVWRGYPTLVWHGSVERIELRSSDNRQVLAQLHNLNLADANEPIHQLTYAGKALQPGETYTWVITPRNLEALEPLKLQVMAIPARDQVAKDLKTLERSQKLAGATPETIAIRRADYFADRQLWSDFWQTILAVKKPSAALKTTLESTVAAMCKPTAANPKVSQQRY